MDLLEQQIDIARKLLKSSEYLKSNHGAFDRIYPFSNENLKGCFDHFDLQEKDCLTVLGSSDQALDLYLKGASSVTTFDTNPLTQYYYDLKIAAFLSNLTNQEYLDFFSCQNEDGFYLNNISFSKQVFNNLKQFLTNKESYIFWNTLFQEYNPLDIRMGGKLFCYQIHDTVLKNTINYLKIENYKLLQNISHNIKIDHINCDINLLPTKINKNFDFIYLSNIIEYVDSPSSLELFKKIIMDLTNHLKENGIIVVGYMYTPENIDTNIEKIFSSKIINSIFYESEFSYLYFDSIEQIATENFYHDSFYLKKKNKDRDACLIYVKK